MYNILDGLLFNVAEAFMGSLTDDWHHTNDVVFGRCFNSLTRAAVSKNEADTSGTISFGSPM